MDTPLLLKEQVFVIKPKDISLEGLWGGAVGGLICALMVISMKWLGYDNMAMSDYVKLWPRILLFGTVGGGAGGWLSSRTTDKQTITKILHRILSEYCNRARQCYSSYPSSH